MRPNHVEIEQDELDKLRLDNQRLDWLIKYVEISGGLPAADTITMVDDAIRLGHSPAVAAQLGRAIGVHRERRRARPTDPRRPSA